MIIQQLLKEYLEYRDGHLWWINKSITNKIDGRFGGKTDKGYISGTLKGKRYYEHRLIWFYHYGQWPKVLDHINNVRDDNRVENLRECNHQQNQFNRLPNPNSSSKYKGVYWHKRKLCWYTCYRFSGKLVHIGYFNSEVEAYNAYVGATKKVHKDFQNV